MLCSCGRMELEPGMDLCQQCYWDWQEEQYYKEQEQLYYEELERQFLEEQKESR